MWPVARASQSVNLSLVVNAGNLANMGKMPMPQIGHIATGSTKLFISLDNKILMLYNIIITQTDRFRD